MRPPLQASLVTSPHGWWRLIRDVKLKVDQGLVPLNTIKAIKGNFARNKKEKAETYFFACLLMVGFPGMLIYLSIFECALERDDWWLYILATATIAIGSFLIWSMKVEIIFGGNYVSRIFPSGKKESILKDELVEASIIVDRYGNYSLNLVSKTDKMAFHICDSLKLEIEKNV